MRDSLIDQCCKLLSPVTLWLACVVLLAVCGCHGGHHH